MSLRTPIGRVLGLGSAKAIDALEIRWPAPSTRVDTFKGVSGGRYITITEGKGIGS